MNEQDLIKGAALLDKKTDISANIKTLKDSGKKINRISIKLESNNYCTNDTIYLRDTRVIDKVLDAVNNVFQNELTRISTEIEKL